jgi:hypothetical protein
MAREQPARSNRVAAKIDRVVDGCAHAPVELNQQFNESAAGM